MQNLLLASMLDNFKKTLIVDDRWKMYLDGLEKTLIIALGALIIGLLIGLSIAVVKFVNKKFGKLNILSKIFDVYIYIIRGTPMVLQLMIMYFIVLVFIKIDVVVAIISFGVNSGAYVAEIIRGGLESVDDGQMEAGRSMGLSVGKTMRYIIIPQAIRRALPAMSNEFIALIKETSIVGYIGLVDITKVANQIQSRTLDAFFPLIIAAIIYLILVYTLTFLLKKLERRLSRSDRN